IPWDTPFTILQDSAANIVLRRAPEPPHSLRPLHNASKHLTLTELVDATLGPVHSDMVGQSDLYSAFAGSLCTFLVSCHPIGAREFPFRRRKVCK
ncbi:hypothetical protein PISMIDRAFT_687220, partial [Pisolithus microcarpus 441]